MNKINLEPEVRCNHYIDSNVKKLWSVQLDLLEQLKRICEKYNIKYFASGGTLLGAVRHKGYIPWDDDIDVFMMADDYEKFCEVAAGELSGCYYFQRLKTMSRIRNSNTTALTEGDLNYLKVDTNHNCGVFIDIFPLHNVYDNRILRMGQKLIAHIFKRIESGSKKSALLRSSPREYWKYNFSKAVLLWKIFCLFYEPSQKMAVYQSMLKMCKKSSFVGMVSFMGINDKYIWAKEWFSETIEMPFENTTIICPKEYDMVLKQQYGDYMVFKKGGAIHTMVVFDAEVPYKDKLKDIKSIEHLGNL